MGEIGGGLLRGEGEGGECLVGIGMVESRDEIGWRGGVDWCHDLW